MRIWLQQVGEPLPIDCGSRLMRTWHLAEALWSLGHEVVWWASTFDHFKKRHRALGHQVVELKNRMRLEMLTSPGYRNNVSFARIRDHQILASRFRQAARARPKPDLLLASFPPVELCVEMIKYAAEVGIPCVVDVRDLWPDAFLDYVPRGLDWAARIALAPKFHAARDVCRGASAICAVSDAFLDWALRNAGRQRRSADCVFPLGAEAHAVSQAASSDIPALELLGNPRLVAAFVGTFGTTYDVSTIIRAAHRLWRQGRRDLAFILAGDGEMGAAWRAEAEGLPNVMFTGWLSADQIRDLLRQAHVGLVAYKAGAPQSLPNKPFEYMAGGLALVNSLPGEMAALVQRERIGINYHPGDDEDLANGIRRLLDDGPAVAEMGRRARALLEERFDSKHIAKDMARLLVDIAGGPTAASRVAPVTC